MDSDDARKLCHRVELIGGNGCLDPVVRRRHLRLHLATRALDRLHDLALRIGERRLDVVALALAEFAAALGLDDGDGVSLHLDDDGHVAVRADGARRIGRVDRAARGRRREARAGVVVGRRRQGCGCGEREQGRSDHRQDASLQGGPPFVQGRAHSGGRKWLKGGYASPA